MSQDNSQENKPLLPAQDAVPTPPSGSPLEQALKRAQMEAEGVQAEAAVQESPETGASGNAGTSSDQQPDETAEAKSEEAEKSEQAEAQPEEANQEKGTPPAENSTAAAEDENREQETAPESLPAEKESSVPAIKEEEPEEEKDGEGGQMGLLDHLREFRKRMGYSFIATIVGFVCCWCFVETIFDILTKPMLDVLPQGSAAIYTTLPEAFFTRMYIAFICALFVASPVIFYQIWAFIKPGLYKKEKRFIIPVAIVSAIFFIAGGLFCYYIVFHYAFSFFMSYATQDIVHMPKISDYLDFVLKLILAFGLVFEMPIFSFFLARMGVLTADKMREIRSYAILIIFIVAAILTPPDVVSQLLMAIPMLLLYEVSILVAVIFGKKKTAAEDDSEEEVDEEDAAEDEDKPQKEGTEKPAAESAATQSANASPDTAAAPSADTEAANEEPAGKDASPEAGPVSEAASGTESGSGDAASEKDEAQEQKTISLEKKASPSDKEQPAKGQE